MSSNKIKKIEIKGLWNKYDITWELNEQVNILIGKNGTGKTTILNLIKGLLSDKDYLIRKYEISKVDIKLFNKNSFSIEKSELNLSDFMKDLNVEKMEEFFSGLKNLKNNLSKLADTKNTTFKDEKSEKSIETKEKLKKENPNVVKLSTFDMELKNKKAVKDYGDKEHIQTELDVLLNELITNFKLYQLKLKNLVEEENKKTDEAIKNLTESITDSPKELKELKELVKLKEININKIYEKKEKFKNIVSSLFKDTNKMIELDENNSIIFKSDLSDDVITPYQLSSGEKQMLVMLLTTILQENREVIFLMDEPELSLHVEWQRVFIDNIIELNPNAQIILVTHSSSIFSKGWMDKITKIENITTRV